MGMVKHLAKLDFQRQVPVPNFAEGMNFAQHNLLRKNWITRFLNRHPILAAQFASRIDRQRAYASNPHTIQTHFQKLGKIMRTQWFSDKAITNVDEKGFVMGISPHIKVVTRRGKINPRIQQDGTRKFITALEAVSADGFVFPPYLIGKGSVHIFDWYKNVVEEDHNSRWAVSAKSWTDSKIGYDWLTNVYDPISKACCPGESHLLILDGYVSHINYKFLTFCEANHIVVFCLPPHSTHLLQPLDVGLFAPLQLAYWKAIEDYFLTTTIWINRDIFFPLYKEACQQAYIFRNITAAFKQCGIVPFNPRSVLSELPNSTALSRATSNSKNHEDSSPLGYTPYTKCELRQQTSRAPMVANTATTGQICNLILRFSHTAEYMSVQADIANTEAQRVREAVKKLRPSMNDLWKLGKGIVAGVMTGENILKQIQVQEKIDKEKAAKKQFPTRKSAQRAVVVTPVRPRIWFQLELKQPGCYAPLQALYPVPTTICLRLQKWLKMTQMRSPLLPLSQQTVLKMDTALIIPLHTRNKMRSPPLRSLYRPWDFAQGCHSVRVSHSHSCSDDSQTNLQSPVISAVVWDMVLYIQ